MNQPYRAISPKGIYRSHFDQGPVSGRRPRCHNINSKFDYPFDLTLTLRKHGLNAEVLEVKDGVASLRCSDMADYYVARHLLKHRGISSTVKMVTPTNGKNGGDDSCPTIKHSILGSNAAPERSTRKARPRPTCLVCGKIVGNCRAVRR